MANTSKIIVLGAGLAGLSTAYHLEQLLDPKEKSGISYEIFEQESEVGGLCRSVKQDGFTFDYTGHILHLREDYTRKLIRHLLDKNYLEHKRKSWIYSKDVYTLYPFQANTYGLPPAVIKECVLGFIKAQCRKHTSALSNPSHRSFYQWIIATFGEGIARHFMVPYNEKIWTVHPRDLTCDWMHSFVPQPKIQEVITGALTDQRKSFGYNAVFLYPKAGGIQVLGEAFSHYIKNLRRNFMVTGIDLDNKTVQINDAHWHHFDKLVTSLPLKQLVRLMDKVPPAVRRAADELRCNSVLNVNLGVGRAGISDKHWIYFPEKKFIFYRAGFLSNFSGALGPEGTSSIYSEVAYDQEAGRQMPQAVYHMPRDKEKIVARVKKDLFKAGILKNNDKILTVNVLDIKYAYVIYDKKRNKNLGIINSFLHKKGIYSIGRYGGWKYMTMEEAILEGKKTAERLLKK
jgi:protoporphyrinogen oxidase